MTSCVVKSNRYDNYIELEPLISRLASKILANSCVARLDLSCHNSDPGTVFIEFKNQIQQSFTFSPWFIGASIDQRHIYLRFCEVLGHLSEIVHSEIDLKAELIVSESSQVCLTVAIFSKCLTQYYGSWYLAIDSENIFE